MIKKLLPDHEFALDFTKDNLINLSPYFGIDYSNADLDQRILFFENMLTLSRRNLGLAHCIQHSNVAKLIVQLSDYQEAKDHVSQSWHNVIGSYSVVKNTDNITVTDGILSGTKKWLSNLHCSDFVVLQAQDKDKNRSYVYVDLSKIPHSIDHSYFTPIGMKAAKPGALMIHHQPIPPEYVLGNVNDSRYADHGNFASWNFITNHLGIITELFLEIKQYAENNNCGAGLNLHKIEMDISLLTAMWRRNLVSLARQDSISNELWHERNTQLVVSKKTLISILQLILEIGVSYYIDAESKFSERFRDALNYTSHMHPLYRFNKEKNLHFVNFH